MIDQTSTAPPPAPWRALPDDLPLVATLRWLHVNLIPIQYHPDAAGGDIHLSARIGEDDYWALLRDVRTAPTEVGR